MLKFISKKSSSIYHARAKWSWIFATVPLVICSLVSVAVAIELGAVAPSFSLKNLEDKAVTLEPPLRGRILILLFIDSSGSAIEMLGELNEVVQKSSDCLSLLAPCPENPEELSKLIKDEALRSSVLRDDKNVTFIQYGFRKRLPAAVIVAPGGVVASFSAPLEDARKILVKSADTFISMELPDSALKVYQSMPEDWLKGEESALAIGYASVLMEDADAADRIRDSLKGYSPSLSPEGHTLLGFLRYREEKYVDALAECRQAPGDGFANWIAGMVKARAGECDTASAMFGKATKGDFTFMWQKARAFNMAAGIAEAKGDEKTALRLYKKAFAIAPVNPTINANLLAYHWRLGNFPAAHVYAKIIKLTNARPPVIRALVDEFNSEMEFAKDKSARKQLAERLKKARSQKSTDRNPQKLPPREILMYDLTFTGCAPALNCMSLATAGLLRRSLEGIGSLVAPGRPQIIEAAKHLNIAKSELQDPTRLVEVAKALSVDLMTLGEVGSYKGKYLLNLRIAEVNSGNIIAVTSERFDSLEDISAALQRSAAVLMQKIAAHYTGA